MGESMQILHRFSSTLGGTTPPGRRGGGRGDCECTGRGRRRESTGLLRTPPNPHCPRLELRGSAPAACFTHTSTGLYVWRRKYLEIKYSPEQDS